MGRVGRHSRVARHHDAGHYRQNSLVAGHTFDPSQISVKQQPDRRGTLGSADAENHRLFAQPVLGAFNLPRCTAPLSGRRTPTRNLTTHNRSHRVPTRRVCYRGGSVRQLDREVADAGATERLSRSAPEASGSVPPDARVGGHSSACRQCLSKDHGYRARAQRVFLILVSLFPVAFNVLGETFLELAASLHCFTGLEFRHAWYISKCRHSLHVADSTDAA